MTLAMADNYFERRMEDMRSGRLAGDLRSKARTPHNPTGRKSLEGLRAIVTGGANGIGLEIVKELRRCGASVDIIDKDRKRGAEAAQATGARFIPLDLADTTAFRHALEEIIAFRGDIDIIVNDAAKVDFLPLEENSGERLIESLRVNVVPALEGATVLARHRASLPQANPYGGRIINISSTRAVMSEEGTENYTASKGALASLTHALMMSLAKYGITVNSISPGWILTDPSEPTTDADHEQHPSRRIGTPADIARICTFLARPENNFINGDNITADGGMTRRMIYV